MSIASRVAQFTDVFNKFRALDPLSVLKVAVHNEYDGPNVAETSASLRFVFDSFEALFSVNGIQLLSFNAITTFQSHLQNVVNAYNQFLSAREQGSFQQFASHVDAFAALTRTQGIPGLAAGGAQLESATAAVTKELDRLVQNNEEVDALKKDVRTLITPAVAGSLSQAFMRRRNALTVWRIIWLILTFVVGAFAVRETYEVIKAVADVMKGIAPQVHADLFWPALIIRSIVLIPLFAAFGFAFSQYRKERDFEEEYAHKAAIASSLPNYGDLAREQSVRDRIVTGATTVIFSSPTVLAKQAENSEATIAGMKEMLESLGKFLPKR
jgi:hypothetical protein